MDPTWGWFEWVWWCLSLAVPGVIVARWVVAKLKQRQWWALLAAPFGYVLIWVPMFMMCCKPYYGARSAAANADCQERLKTLTTAMMMYTEDHDERFPNAAGWRSDLIRYVKDEAVYHCPLEKKGAFYLFNTSLSGRKLSEIDEPARTVLFFETDVDGRSQPQPPPRNGRHAGTYNVSLVDGHVRRMMPGRERELIWTIHPAKHGESSAASPRRE